MGFLTRQMFCYHIVILFTLLLMTNSFIKCDEVDASVNDVVDGIDEQISTIKPVLTFDGNVILQTPKSKVDELSTIFKKNIDKLKNKHKKLDIVFLCDSSSSVGKVNFESEIKFIKKLLSDFPVSYEYTRVAIVTFSSQAKIYRYVDQISKPSIINDKCSLLNHEINQIVFSGGGTHTYGAFEEAKKIFQNGRLGSKKLIFLVTDGFSNGRDPVPIANELKHDNITIYTIGIQSGNYEELYNISSSPGTTHSYLLDSFSQFESLARKALHADYKVGETIQVQEKFCNILCVDGVDKDTNSTEGCCDKNAECSCDTNSGHYKCLCKPGFFGSGLVNSCHVCANGTYSDTWNECKSCPDKNHITLKEPALSIADCVCKNGFKAGDRNNCETITCPELTPPKNGYFVTSSKGCGQVLNAACGARCKLGFLLTGSSIRLCQENGTWSGTETECVLKTCPALKVPYYGQAICKNSDLNLYFDYSPRNASFIANYSRDIEKFTERMPIDTECTFKCGTGFYIVGSRKRNCLPLKEGKWDGLQTSCKQILCQPLPRVKFGSYEPLDCTEDKSEHGSNCTLTCEFGFELKGGPSTRVCNGKRNGIWSHKNKNPRCVDVTPPNLSCPGDYSLPLDSDMNYTIVRQLHQPYVFDNSNENVTYWTKPALKENGIKLGKGNHTFTYIAVDNFKNKAKCTFIISVIDIHPPVFEECISRTLYIGAEKNKNTTWLEWDEPIAYDNSFEPVTLNKSLDFGYLDVGTYEVVYTAIDTSDNEMECALNITVKKRQCENIESPINGQSICVSNITHTLCEVSCNVGYGIYNEDKELSDTVRLVCENRIGKWVEKLPDCSLIEQPEFVEEVFTISLDADPIICNNAEAQNDLNTDFISVIKENLCHNQEDCEIISQLPICETIETGNDAENNTFYNVVRKRETSRHKEPKANVKIRIYTNIGKRLGIWQYNISKTENIERIKQELGSVSTNKNLKRKLIQYKIDVTELNLDEVARCRQGMVSKNLKCVQCPAGTYHNILLNTCKSCPIGTYSDDHGRTECTSCPHNFVTRKSHSKSFYDCKQMCPPGQIAKLKPIRGPDQHPNSLMPYCRRCNVGEYNPFYDQLKCLKCPEGYTSLRGTTALADCFEKSSDPCAISNICGEHGNCVPEKNNNHYYCICKSGFVGAHCEIWENSCLSVPCLNGGTCEMAENGTVTCKCPESYYGAFCETFKDPCNANSCMNGGTCIEIYGKPVCECKYGFEGKFCEKYNNFCDEKPCELGECVNTEDGFKCICPPGQIGRRCHLKPCDYLPCHGSSICVDLAENITTKDSYRCECPIGLKGQNCTEIDNPCDQNPCKNNGICTAVALRSLRQTNIFNRYIDDQKYDQFECKCPPYFYGPKCETLVTPDFILEFNKTNVDNYIKMEGPKHNLHEISFCAWLNTNDSMNYGTLLSYAAGNVDNMFTLTDYNGLILYVNGSHEITDIVINDGYWHFVCVTWRSENGYFEIYLDGKLVNHGRDLNLNGEIEGNGLLIIGQEQDKLGTSFSESESFIGKISYLDIWKRALNGYEVEELFSSCEPYQGDLFAWTDFKLKIHGNIHTYNSNFCKPCPKNLTILHGNVMYVGNNALYRCHEGYYMQGAAIRHCLRTSYWEKSYPVCKLIRCGYVGSISNGNVTVTKSSYNGTATFKCDTGYEMIGEPQRICTRDGKWSGSNPECVSKYFCEQIEIPEFSTVIYATEKGIINVTNTTQLRTGTFLEIQCQNGTHPSDDNLITCLSNGKWDNNPPKCIPEVIEADVIDTEEIILESEPITTSTLIPLTKLIPDRTFWKSLHSYLFFGCQPIDASKRSSLCNKYPTNHLTDLMNFNGSLNNDLQNTDQKLIDLFENTLASINFYTIDIGSFFQYVLYQNETDDEDKFDKNMEDSFRLTLCFYINSLSGESNPGSSQSMESSSIDYDSEEDIGVKIIRLLKKIVQPAFIKYIEAENVETTTTTTKRPLFGLQALIASKEAERQ